MAPEQDIWAEDGPWAHERYTAAAPPSAAPGHATGAAPGPSMGGQLRQEFAWMPETLPEPWAYARSKCPLTHEALALELFNRALARATAACEADKPAAMAHALLFAGCSRLAAEAMESGARAGLLPPQGLENLSVGLRLAEPIVVRLAQSNVTPRMVVEVLALWVRKATGGGPAGAKGVFSERPTLERLLYRSVGPSAIIFTYHACHTLLLFGLSPPFSVQWGHARRTARGAICGQQRVSQGHGEHAGLHARRARRCGRAKDRDALGACLTAEQRAAEAREHATAAAVREAKWAFQAAASLVNPALAARGGGAMAAPPGPGNLHSFHQ